MLMTIDPKKTELSEFAIRAARVEAAEILAREVVQLVAALEVTKMISSEATRILQDRLILALGIS
jgi:hypothetical protein